ncbi:uncharacterized protein LOC123564478 [Mercenaria mercenaria]|uniref:uncharacterized protein LOC123564478 n=1 Tax=Mercenaria mercenaria TaxID=6596 RepID=UPI00234FB302|nr:uncharacterized protein LOC123564478 [Mercenaria mercenaria]
MAGASGCYSSNIENGFVATSSCQVFSSNSIYCRYYCNDGYVKTASTVYCAGNDKWVPSGSHPTQDSPACRKSTDPVSGCENIFFENGYVVTCPVSSSSTKRDCMYRCHHGYKPASSSVHCVRNEWLTSDSYSDPCIKDGTTAETTVMTGRPTVSPRSSPRTTYPGYYDDPNLKMDVSPVIFVGAVIGGFIVLGLLIFAIFFRAHKKSNREARIRSAFIAACDPLSLQNDYTNNNTDTQADDSEFRDIARRIISQSSNQQQQSSSSPPAYEASGTDLTSRGTFSDPSAPPYSTVTGVPNTFDNPSVPPYSAVYNSGTGLHETAMLQPFDQMQIPQENRIHEFNRDTTHSTSVITDKPPPYEDLQNQNAVEGVSHPCEKDVSEERTCENSFGPPPPYTTYDGKG